MAITDEVEQNVSKLWVLVAELTEQLNKTKTVSALLLAQSTHLKAQATHAGTGFVLRRFNMNMPKEEYEAELQRMNTGMADDNQQLQYDNKQLNALLKEYEQSLESVMSSFRLRAHEVQQQELSMMRHYEKLLLSRETGSLEEQLAAQSALSFCVEKVSKLLRMTLRSLGGEDPEPLVHEDEVDDRIRLSQNVDDVDWALQREIELVRLERENEELRHMLTVSQAQTGQRKPVIDEAASRPTRPPPLIGSPLRRRRSMVPRADRADITGTKNSENKNQQDAAPNSLAALADSK